MNFAGDCKASGGPCGELLYVEQVGLKPRNLNTQPYRNMRALDSILSPIDLIANVFGPMNTSLSGSQTILEWAFRALRYELVNSRAETSPYMQA